MASYNITTPVRVYQAEYDGQEPTSSAEGSKDYDDSSDEDGDEDSSDGHEDEGGGLGISDDDRGEAEDEDIEYDSEDWELERLETERLEKGIIEREMEEYEQEQLMQEAMCEHYDEAEEIQEEADSSGGYDSDDIGALRLELEDERLQAEQEAEDMEDFYQQQLLQDEMWEDNDQYPDTDDDSISSIPSPLLQLSQVSPLLYRVFDADSVSKYGSTGFTAGSSHMPSTPSDFAEMVENHAEWRNRINTPFISVTNSNRVVNWQISIRDRPNIMVAIIDTAILVDQLGVQVWEVDEAMDHFGIDPPGNCSRRTFDDEYICGLRIPLLAILGVCEPHLFEEMAEEYLLER